MKTTTAFAFALLAAAPLAAQNIELLGHLDYQALRGSNLSNLWGYTDEEGNEYALVGVNGTWQANSGGLSVVDVTDPADPQEVFFAPSAPSNWREIKVWNDHAYITTEAQAGLLIVDLSPLPQSTVLPTTIFHGNGWITSHSLFIDENGRLYIHGSNRGNGGVIMYDLTQDPMVPVEVGDFDFWYCHDSFVRGDTLYGAHITDGFFSMVDVSDPANPMLLGTQPTPNHFTHNCWLDDTGHYLFTTDEQPASFVTAYDVSDPTDIREVDRLQSDPDHHPIPHNTYWLNDFLVTSYYTYGVTIYDASVPELLVETGHYDTSPTVGSNFQGAWGVYPFLPSGNLLVSDIERGLFVLAPTYTHATWLHGHITEAGSGENIYGATVTIGVSGAMATSDLEGRYGTGFTAPGMYDITVHADGYNDRTITGVELPEGVNTTLDVELDLSGTGVGDAGSVRPSLVIAPNPSDGRCTVAAPGLGQARVDLFDAQGRRVGPSRTMRNGALHLDAALEPGTYTVQAVDAEGGRSVARMIVR